MALRNDQDHQYVNGSIGVVQGFTSSQDGWPIVAFDNGNVVTMKPAVWEVMDGDVVLASVNQIPLRCAWAITIHKSQGMTLDRAVMDLRRSFVPGMGYVALSRVESLNGLFLDGINEQALQVSPDAVILDADLRSKSRSAVLRLADEGVQAFIRQEFVEKTEDEFMQDQLF